MNKGVIQNKYYLLKNRKRMIMEPYDNLISTFDQSDVHAKAANLSIKIHKLIFPYEQNNGPVLTREKHIKLVVFLMFIYFATYKYDEEEGTRALLAALEKVKNEHIYDSFVSDIIAIYYEIMDEYQYYFENNVELHYDKTIFNSKFIWDKIIGIKVDYQANEETFDMFLDLSDVLKEEFVDPFESARLMDFINNGGSYTDLLSSDNEW